MNYLLNTSTDPYFNMAFDSYVLENTDFEGVYLWQNAPSVILGLNQSIYAEVNLPYLREHGILPVRRVSGGGAVYHDLGNVNYTFVGSGAWVASGPSVIAAALRSMGVPADVTGRNDILVDGRKCSGYAKRYALGGGSAEDGGAGCASRRVMVHGTLMYDVDLEALTQALAVPGSKLSAAGVESVRMRVANLHEYLSYDSVQEFMTAMLLFCTRCHFNAGTLCTNPAPTRSNEQGPAHIITPCALRPEQLAEIEHIADTKFRSWEWIYGHSPSAEFSRTCKFPCGTVTVRYSLKHGRFTDVSFEGDFLGARPASELAAMMTGMRPEDLYTLPVGEYFDGLSVEEFCVGVNN